MIKQLTEFEIKQWGSHKEVIIDYCMKKTTIDTMVEVGVGEFSTPVYKNLVKKLISYETDVEWFQFISKKYTDPNIEYILSTRDNLAPSLITLFNNNKIDLVLVDHSVENTYINQRAYIANISMLHNIPFIVIHDICQDILKDVTLTKNYNYFINNESINPSLLIEKK